MKKFLLVLTIITLMAGMSLPALADEDSARLTTIYKPYCEEDPVDMAFPVYLEILPWASIEFGGEFDFKEVGFCDLDGYKLYWINGGAFMSRTGGASNVALFNEKGESAGTWAGIEEGKKVHVNGHLSENDEVNPRVTVTTNTAINLTFKFDEEREDWPDGLPFYIPVYRKATGGHQTGYVARFGRNVSVLDGLPIYDYATLNIPASTLVEYHLAGGILFEENRFDDNHFWEYEAREYYTTIVATVDVP